MFDLKAIEATLSQLEEERGIPRDKVIEAIEYALAAAYKKDYGKKGQIVRATFSLETGDTEFSQVKIVVEPSMLKPEPEEGEELEEELRDEPEEITDEEDQLIRFNPEHHILIDEARLIKKDVEPEEELIFPLETKGDYGRIAAQTAKQVIIQRIREAEKVSVLDEFGKKQGDIVSGTVQRIERGNIFVDLGKATGMLAFDEQIRGERFKQGERVRAYLFLVEETPRGINLKLSRSHPKFVEKLFEIEAPEIANAVVEIKSVAREAGSRSKIAVFSNDGHVDPVGSCVGQRGVRVTTVMSELGGEKIDIIEWSEDPVQFIEDALSPAAVRDVEIDEEEKRAVVEVIEDQLSLAIGKGGQNVRLAAKLTGWKIDIKGVDGELVAEDGSVVEKNEDEEVTDKAGDEVDTEEVTETIKEESADPEKIEQSEEEVPENIPEEIEEEIEEEAEVQEEEETVEEAEDAADENVEEKKA
jgi:N utilization substance protein A